MDYHTYFSYIIDILLDSRFKTWEVIVERLEPYKAGMYHIHIYTCISFIQNHFHILFSQSYTAFVFDSEIAGLLTINPRVVT